MTQKFCENLLTKAAKDGIQKRVVGGIIEDHQGRALILRRSVKEQFFPGLDELPSGHLEAEESLAEGLAREIKEETGLAVKAIRQYVDAFDYASSSGKPTRQWNFAVDIEPGRPVVLNPEEHQSYTWAQPQQIGELQCSEQTTRSLRKYWAKRSPPKMSDEP